MLVTRMVPPSTHLYHCRFALSPLETIDIAQVWLVRASIMLHLELHQDLSAELESFGRYSTQSTLADFTFSREL